MKLLIITQKVDENDVALGFFIQWLKKISLKTEKLDIICMLEGEHKYLGDNVRVLSLGKEKKFSKIRQLFNFYKNIFNIVPGVDFIFVHMNPIWVTLGWPVFKFFRKPIALWYAHKSVTLKLRLAHILADRIFSISPESFRIKSKKAIFTNHGIDIDLFKPSKENDFLDKKTGILSVGRITPSKAQEILIKAADYLINRRGIRDIFFTFVGGPAMKGDYVYLEKIKKLIKDLNLDNYITFKGVVAHDELPSIYNGHKIYVNNSLTGSIDKDVLEAAASGNLVLTSNEAYRDQLDEKYFFKTGDYKELGNKIMNLINQKRDPALRNWIIERHNLDNLVDTLDKEFKKLIRNTWLKK